MKVSVLPSVSGGRIKAIASKSVAHRLLICAAFAKGETYILCEEINEDISATVRCLCALGADIEREGGYYHVKPVKTLSVGAMLDCGESGSTLRFLVPVCCMLGADAFFWMSGRLPSRPMSPLREELEACGIVFSEAGSNPLICKGKINGTSFSISGSVSSQFISGLLFAIAVSGRDGEIKITDRLESAPYLELTVDALKAFGVNVELTEGKFVIKDNKGLISPTNVITEGDWSNAAFPLAIGVMGREAVTLTGIDRSSKQGDRAFLDILRAFGAELSYGEDSVTAYPSRLHGIRVDASQIPDLVPIIATLASTAEGETVIYNAERLRIKESDRLYTTKEMLNALGAHVRESEDGLIIEGVESLSGGRVSSFNDHRIAMSAAVASLVSENGVIIEDAEAAAKSYPGFWADIERLGIQLKKV